MGYWDKENDIVWICPNNTKGKVVEIDGLKIGLPKQPPKKEILFHDLPKEEQYWRREDIPEELKKIDTDEEFQQMPRMFREKFDPYISAQYDKRRNGVWFYNYGEPTYLTPNHWMALQWVKPKFGYMAFLEPQWKLEVHWAACVVDPRCLGQNFVKNRRFGWTTLASVDIVNEATQTKNGDFGILSKTEKDSKKIIFRQHVWPVFDSLPFFFKPLTSGRIPPVNDLNLRAPSKMITKNFKKREGDKGLDTIIRAEAPGDNAFDGARLARLLHDEAGKYEKPLDITVSWQVQKKCFINRTGIVGKCRMGTTVNAMAKGGGNYKKLFYDGWLDKSTGGKGRNANGRTPSGMYSIFIPAYECIVYDKYGRSIVDDPPHPIETIDGTISEVGGRTFQMNEREALKDDAILYNEEIRQMPFTLREAFLDKIESAAFNIQKIEEQSAYIDLMRNKQNPVIKGRFEWTDGFGSDVKWSIDNKSYRFKVTWLQDPELRNKRYMKRGQWCPANGWMGVGGLDSYGVDQAVYGGSKGAIHFFNKDNPRAPSNAFVLQYIHRPPSLIDFYEDALKAAIFYGYPILIEDSKYEIATHFIEWGYGEYLLSRPRISLNPMAKPTPAQMIRKGIPPTPEIIRQLNNMLDDYINKYVGYNDETGEIGDGVFFDELLEDWKQYQPDKRTKFDATISSSHALYASKIRIDGGYDDGEKKKTPLLRTYRV